MAAFLADGEKAAPRCRRLSRPAASAGSAAAAARTAGRPLPAELWRAFPGPAHCPGAGVGGGGPGAPERGRGATPAPVPQARHGFTAAELQEGEGTVTFSVSPECAREGGAGVRFDFAFTALG